MSQSMCTLRCSLLFTLFTVLSLIATISVHGAACNIPEEAEPEDVSNPDQVIGTGTPESCTSAAFVQAVAQGGVITFNCGS
jgi:hypothetical protein